MAWAKLTDKVLFGALFFTCKPFSNYIIVRELLTHREHWQLHGGLACRETRREREHWNASLWNDIPAVASSAMPERTILNEEIIKQVLFEIFVVLVVVFSRSLVASILLSVICMRWMTNVDYCLKTSALHRLFYYVHAYRSTCKCMAFDTRFYSLLFFPSYAFFSNIFVKVSADFFSSIVWISSKIIFG